MKILLDHCLPKRLKREFPNHELRTAYEMGWANLKNGELLAATEAEFGVLLTADRNIQHQQDFTKRSLSMVVFLAANNRFDTLLPPGIGCRNGFTDHTTRTSG